MEIPARQYENYRMFVEGTNDLIIRADSLGRLLFANHASVTFFGLHPEQCIGMNVYDFIHSEDRAETKRRIVNWIKQKTPHAVYENRIQSYNGDVRHVLWDLSFHYTDDDYPSVSGFARDITRMRKMELELLNAKKLEAIGTLAGGIAHDFNNTLTAILGNISLARMYLNPGEKAAACLEKAEEAVEIAKNLANKLITFSKGGEPIRTPMSIIRVIKKSVAQVIRENTIKLHFFFDDNLPLVAIDEIQIQQAVENILYNAKEAMPDGGNIEIQSDCLDIPADNLLNLNPGRYIHVMLKDDGAGIEEKNLIHIFDPYFTTKGLGAQKGMGLGLSIAHSVVKKHGGAIKIESQAGSGTTCHIYLPVMKIKTRVHAEDQPPIPADGRVLVMDDEQFILDVVGQMLTHIGFDVQYAKDGHEAADKYKAAVASGEPFLFVILDLTVKDGVGAKTAIHMLKKIDPQVRAFVSSGYSYDPVMENYKAYGFAGAIRKPYDLDKLIKALSIIA